MYNQVSGEDNHFSEYVEFKNLLIAAANMEINSKSQEIIDSIVKIVFKIIICS